MSAKDVRRHEQEFTSKHLEFLRLQTLETSQIVEQSNSEIQKKHENFENRFKALNDSIQESNAKKGYS